MDTKQIKLLEFKNNKSEILRGIFICSINKKCNRAVLMAGGFERAATTEKKFKVLADKLVRKNIFSFRFDYSGLGLSDGDFSETTIKKMSEDFLSAYETIKEKTGCKEISVIVHSLSACVVAKLLDKVAFERIVLIAPALNQRDLLRYWFVASSVKSKDPLEKVVWNNFKDFLNEELFLSDCEKKGKMTKENYIQPDYFLENKDKDYSCFFSGKEDVLHLHGDSDDKVPFESMNIKIGNKIIIKKGNHDLERPDMVEQWLKNTINFIRRRI